MTIHRNYERKVKRYTKNNNNKQNNNKKQNNNTKKKKKKDIVMNYMFDLLMVFTPVPLKPTYQVDQ